MRICHSILIPVVFFVRAIIRVVREVVRTVCEWVTSTVRVVREVCEEVCGWLGPFSFLCDWVCKLVEVVETVTEWVCREVIDRFFEWVEVLIEYVVYILNWVCWFIDWIPRLPALLFCLIGFNPRRVIRVCVKILTDRAGVPGVPIATVQTMMRDAARILQNCNMGIAIVDFQLVEREELLDSTTCEFGGLFSGFFVWFSRNACAQRCTVTVYFVRDIGGPNILGCAYPGANWVIVDATGTGGTVVQEIGHLVGLFGHSDDPNNVMTDVGGGTADQITRGQCCMFRTSRFACGPDPILVARPLEVATTIDPTVGPPGPVPGGP